MEEKIRNYLSETLLVEFGEGDGRAGPDTDLFESGDIDSFGFVQLVAFLEKEFGIEIGDDELLGRALNSLSGICGLVERKVGA